MNINTLKKAGIGTVVTLGSLYVLFLAAPLFLSPILNSHSADISKMAEDAIGLKLKLDKMKIVTTPKLTAGVKIGHTELLLPNDESILSAGNAQLKLALLPILAGKIRIDAVGADNIKANLKVQKDGKFLLENYLPKEEEQQAQPSVPMTGLPLGIKLSNHLPDIHVKNYDIIFVDMPTNKAYSISGEKIDISDFILNKKIKVVADGKVVLDGKTQFNYDVKILNRFMPDMDLNELVFNPQPVDETEKTQAAINVIDIFKGFKSNELSADLKADLKIKPEGDDVKFKGYANLDGITLLVDGKPLPKGHADLIFKGKNIKLNSELYTADSELTTVTGDFKTGKHPKINLSVKSNAGLNNIFGVIKSVALASGIDDLKTLSATGALNADFTLKTNLKKVQSDGYLKIPSASINYGLYNIAINNINADVSFADNIVDMKNIGFTVFGQPLKFYGKIQNNADADLHLTANQLSLKGLITAAGQVGLLRENDFRSGTLTMDASAIGRLDKLKPQVNISVDNVNVKNKPSNTGVTLANSTVKITSDGKTFNGDIGASNLRVVNPMASLSAPQAKINIGQKDILIDDTYVLLDNSRIDIAGKITDYMTNKIAIDIKANGALVSSDIKNMIPKEMRADVAAKGKMPLSAVVTGDAKAQKIDVKLNANPSNYVSILDVDALRGKSTDVTSTIKIANDSLKLSNTGIFTGSTAVAILDGAVDNLSSNQKLNLKLSIPKDVSFAIPGFKNSKLQAKGDIKINGHAANPLLKGSVSVPVISLPDMDISINNMNLNLDGPIVQGSGTVKKFKSGGIVAENLTSNFAMKGDTFYLKNISGDAFSGKVNGDVSYNMANGKIGVDFKGSGMNAEKAIEGAAGIKNALSGKLGFTANVKLQGVEYNDMMKSLTGKVTFDIADGTFGNIGRLETFLNAQNILSNRIMSAALGSITKLPVVASTAQFKSINGDMTFNNGWANLRSIKTSGPAMAYYITGRYNLLNGTANVIILGRLSYDVVALLGPIGDLSVEKLTSFIPKFGDLTAAVIRTMTTDPRKENTANIPALSSGKKDYRDFKVEFNGGIESRSSVKSFKWLSAVDTSEIEKVDVKQSIKDTTNAIKDAHNQNVQDIKNTIQDTKDQFNNAKEDIKNLFKF